MNHKNFFALAEQVASWSKDPSSKIGSIAVGENRQVLSMGFNGFPRGILDSSARLNDRPTKYKFMVHSEANLIYNACHNGVCLEGSTLYVVGLPVCSECAKAIIQCGISKVNMKYDRENLPEKWKNSLEDTVKMFDEAGVEYELFYRVFDAEFDS